MDPTDQVVWFHLTEAGPVSEMCVFKLIDKGKCPRICISLITHIRQEPSEKVTKSYNKGLIN
jgi:hypothetical protein